MSLYLTIELIAISVPLALSFEKNLRFYKRWKNISLAIVFSMFIYVSWDVLFTHFEVWEFNPKYNSGISIFKLPLEEHLFFITIPYASLFLFYAINFHFPNFRLGSKWTRALSAILALSSLFIAVTNFSHIYTFINFLVLFVTIVVVYKFSFELLRRYLAFFPVLSIPFIIINGILTGTGIDQEVFKYSDEAITGIRILTFPLEDLFYAFSLIITVIFILEKLEASEKNKLTT